MLVPLVGFAPDLDATQPGVITACVAYVPSYKGMRGAPSAVDVSIDALTAQCRGSAVLTLLDSSRRLIAGTSTHLYEAAGANWADVSRTAGGSYTVATDLSWRYSQYGNVSLAAQKGDKIQFSVTSGNFADISAAPRASIIETLNNQVMAFDYNNGSDHPAGWITSALGDYTNWTPNVANNSYSGDLTNTPGPILGGKKLGTGLVAYKLNSMYLATFQGPPIGWEFDLISDTTGALSHDVVVPITTPTGGQAHIFMGSDDFYYYDGSLPVRIGNPLKDWIFGRLNRAYSFKSIALHDPVNSRINFFYPSSNSGSGVLDSCVVYNYRVNRWGVDDRSVEAIIQYIGATETYADFEAAYPTYDAIPMGTYGAAFLASAVPVPAIFDLSHELQMLNGAAGNCSFTTGDIGDDAQFSTLMRVRPRWVTRPSAAQMTNYWRNELGDTLTSDVTTAMTGSHFDVLREARWHRGMFETMGDAELTALDIEAEGGDFE